MTRKCLLCYYEGITSFRMQRNNDLRSKAYNFSRDENYLEAIDPIPCFGLHTCNKGETDV